MSCVAPDGDNAITAPGQLDFQGVGSPSTDVAHRIGGAHVICVPRAAPVTLNPPFIGEWLDDKLRRVAGCFACTRPLA